VSAHINQANPITTTTTVDANFSHVHLLRCGQHSKKSKVIFSMRFFVNLTESGGLLKPVGFQNQWNEYYLLVFIAVILPKMLSQVATQQDVLNQ
jgi:hypothetical protein